MNEQEFNDKISALTFLIGEDAAVDLFNQEYETLLNDVKALPGPRYAKFARMKKVLLLQAQYLMNEWLKANRESEFIHKNDRREIIQ